MTFSQNVCEMFIRADKLSNKILEKQLFSIKITINLYTLFSHETPNSRQDEELPGCQTLLHLLIFTKF